MKETIIWLNQAAPAKPQLGLPCNGCGVCCAVEPCPVAIAFLWQRKGSCRALEWNEAGQRYQCGMLARPEHYVRLPGFLHGVMRRWVRRWISAGSGCDASDEAVHSQR